MRSEVMDFPGRIFVVDYYTPRRHALLLSSYAEWRGNDETVRIAFFGVSEFFISQRLEELAVGIPLPEPSSGGLLKKYPISWKDGEGYVIARNVDIEKFHGKNISLFRDGWGILGNRPDLPDGWPGC